MTRSKQLCVALSLVAAVIVSVNASAQQMPPQQRTWDLSSHQMRGMRMKIIAHVNKLYGLKGTERINSTRFSGTLRDVTPQGLACVTRFRATFQARHNNPMVNSGSCELSSGRGPQGFTTWISNVTYGTPLAKAHKVGFAKTINAQENLKGAGRVISKGVTGSYVNVTPKGLMDVNRFAVQLQAIPAINIGGYKGNARFWSGFGPGGQITTGYGKVNITERFR